jgi:RNA polymerase sigma-70 factor (ECF subfamily)
MERGSRVAGDDHVSFDPLALSVLDLTLSALAHLGSREPTMSATVETDLFQVWARRLKQSDPSAMEAVFRALHGPLVRYAQGFVRDRAGADDLVQDAFVRIWEGREGLDPTLSLKSFAYRTVRNLCLNRLRDEKNREDLVQTRYEPPGLAPEHPGRRHDADELARRFERWIADLPERQKEALTLSRFQGLSHDEIAEAMDVSPRTVNNHLVKALRTLRDRVRAYEPTLLDS